MTLVSDLPSCCSRLTQTTNWVPNVDYLMRVSTLILALGVILFVLPIPSTFIAGLLVLIVGAVARLLGA